MHDDKMGFSPGMQGWFTLENNPCDSRQQMKKEKSQIISMDEDRHVR